MCTHQRGHSFVDGRPHLLSHVFTAALLLVWAKAVGAVLDERRRLSVQPALFSHAVIEKCTAVVCVRAVLRTFLGRWLADRSFIVSVLRTWTSVIAYKEIIVASCGQYVWKITLLNRGHCDILRLLGAITGIVAAAGVSLGSTVVLAVALGPPRYGPCHEFANMPVVVAKLANRAVRDICSSNLNTACLPLLHIDGRTWCAIWSQTDARGGEGQECVYLLRLCDAPRAARRKAALQCDGISTLRPDKIEFGVTP